MRALIPLLVAAFCAAPSAYAQVQGDPEVIALLMEDAGLNARRSTAEDGAPMLQSNIDGIEFYVYFYDCAKVCGALQFAAGFDLDEAMPMEMANLWNRDRRFGKVYLDRTGDPFVEMDIGLAGEGIGRDNFLDALDTWRVILSEFRDFIDW